MKALIVSDSHGLTNELTKIKSRHSREVDIMIHCGDSELEASSDKMAKFVAVRGNCDYDRQYPNDIVTEFAGGKIYVTHGHLYNVKMSLMQLNYRAKEVGAQIVCFGHSHVAGAELIEGTLFINPGSIRLPRMRKEQTYAIIEQTDTEIKVNFYDIEGKIVNSLTTIEKWGV